jgi:hypothetical protein
MTLIAANHRHSVCIPVRCVDAAGRMIAGNPRVEVHSKA